MSSVESTTNNFLAEPDPVFCSIETYQPGAIFTPRRSSFGKVLFAVSGVAEFTIDGNRLLSPPAYGIWIPAGTMHGSTMLNASRYAKIFVKMDLCEGFPPQSCTLALSDLIKAIVDDFARRGVKVPREAADLRLAMALIDQLRSASRLDSYLPYTDDSLVAQVLDALRANPGDRRSIEEWASELNTTERTLSRRFRSTVGISFGEWRQRHRLCTALSLLDAGVPIKAIASELGFGATSAFIASFRQQTGNSPGKYRDDQNPLSKNTRYTSQGLR